MCGAGCAGEHTTYRRQQRMNCNNTIARSCLGGRDAVGISVLALNSEGRKGEVRLAVEGACVLSEPESVVQRPRLGSKTVCPLALVLQSHYISPLKWIAVCPADTPIQDMSCPL